MDSQTGAGARHVEYILVAEFDIDKGSQLSLQYPTQTGTEEK
jgi:hypothetical protein